MIQIECQMKILSLILDLIDDLSKKVENRN